MTTNAVAPRRVNVPKIISDAEKAIEAATAPEEVLGVEKQLSSLEQLMQDSGLYTPDEIRVINEFRMRARWRLGVLLAKMERHQGKKTISPTGKKLMDELKRIGLDKNVAQEAQRIATLPPKELDAVLSRNHKAGVLNSYDSLIDWARPYWYKASRQKKHRDIAAAATAAAAARRNNSAAKQVMGPFSLIYADPPWKFGVYSEKGLEKTPDQKYPTLTDEEIIDFKVNGQPMSEIAASKCALFMWCTSSNLERALAVMKGWGFTFKSSAVWVKDKTGLGLVFRNQHEVILYGTKGAMPGPQFQPPSVFFYPRGEHSAKPPEVRQAIEKMYPDFDEHSRLELFARETVKGWTPYGFEATRNIVG